jgi:hypothetical protein
MERKPSVRAMFLRYNYVHTFVHSLDAIINHEEYGKWWAEMSNTDRAYVLKGSKTQHKKGGK